MVCMTPGNRDACRVYRDNHGRKQTRLDGLEKGEEYFVVLLTPGDPDSFVGISSVIRWGCTAPRSPTRSPLTASRRTTVEALESPSSQSHNHVYESPSDNGIWPE